RRIGFSLTLNSIRMYIEMIPVAKGSCHGPIRNQTLAGEEDSRGLVFKPELPLAASAANGEKGFSSERYLLSARLPRVRRDADARQPDTLPLVLWRRAAKQRRG